MKDYYLTLGDNLTNSSYPVDNSKHEGWVIQGILMEMFTDYDTMLLLLLLLLLLGDQQLVHV